MNNSSQKDDIEGILLVNKPSQKTSFSLVAALRRHLKVKKIGHAGTLDPFATGVMVMLIGRSYTRRSDQFLTSEKEYVARVCLGSCSDTFDCDGLIVKRSELIPTLEEVASALSFFQGDVEQIPPMFSAKKIQGKKLYELARQGKTVERAPVKVHLKTTLISYQYPFLDINVVCSKGTYIRSIANDLGEMLNCGGYLVQLMRQRSGSFFLKDCVDGNLLFESPSNINLLKHLQCKLSIA